MSYVYSSHNYSFEDKENPKLRSNRRVLVLKVKEGEKAKATTGGVDPRLFSGEDNLIAEMDERTSLWSIRYIKGILPQPLRQKFTTFNKAKEFAEDYYGRRGLQIVEVKD